MKIRNPSRPGFEPRTFGFAYLCANHEATTVCAGADVWRHRWAAEADADAHRGHAGVRGEAGAHVPEGRPWMEGSAGEEEPRHFR